MSCVMFKISITIASNITNIVSETYEWMIKDFNTVKNKSGVNLIIK